MTAVEFLRAIQPEGPWALGAIEPDSDGPHAWETLTDEVAVALFVRKHVSCNVYFQINVVHDDLARRRAGKADVATAIAVHADLDPPEGADLKVWQRQTRGRIERWSLELPKPSVAIFSGSGFQLVWILEEPVELCDESAVEDVEARNRGVAAAIGGDASTVDVSRLLRLPSTMNFPGERKRRKYGRTEPVRSEVIYIDVDRRYALDDFPTVEAEPVARGDGAVACAKSIGKFDADARRRLRERLDGIGPCDGENRTGQATWTVFWSFGRSVDDGWKFLVDWNRRRHDPHTERELRRRMMRALDYKAGTEERRGDAVWSVKVKSDADIDLVFMGSVEPEKVRWLWHGRIPFGAVTLVDGDPGLGKSTVLIDLAAKVSRGAPMPGEMTGRAPATVVLLTAEDALASVVRPRLDAAKADVSRVAVLRAVVEKDGDKQMPCLPANFEQLRRAIDKTKAKLVAIDPLMAYLSEEVNSHKDAEIRRLVMAPLARLAEETGVAVVALRHLRKMGGSAINRGGGTIGFTAAARSVLMFGKNAADPECEDVFIATTKTNLGRRPATLRYRIEGPDDGAGHVEWLGEADGVDADMLAGSATAPKATKTDACETFLRDLLSDGRQTYGAIRQAAEARGFEIDGRPIRDARSRLKVRIERQGKAGVNQVVWWSLPAEDAS
ncbi:MAG: AAA family ATPase [Kofleriaceae bacterium]|nr:AAA family ATPase [Kofleriaceae bacterium]